MFLNRFARYPEILTALTEQKNETLGGMAEAMGVSVERLSALQQGAATIGPAEEWALLGFCDRKRYYDVLVDHGVSPPPYDRYGPFSFDLDPIATDWPHRELIERRTNILGFDVAYPVGVPACALTFKPTWLSYFQDRGFCIFTHKTVREKSKQGKEWTGHSAPHWAFAERVEGSFEYPFDEARVVADMDRWPTHPADFSMVNSFGVPSLEPKDWQKEIRAERELLAEGSVLIVSVMGNPEEADDEADLARSFARTAALAKEAGAQIVEANLSCPNPPPPPGGRMSPRDQGAAQEGIYASPEMAKLVCTEIKSEIGKDFPLLIKIGYLPGSELSRLMRELADTIDGVVAINTIGLTVGDQKGQSFFQGRPKAGLSGSLIKDHARDVLENLVTLRKDVNPDLAILGVGGVTTANDVHEFEDLGIDAVLSCTGAWMNPNLAIEARLSQTVDSTRLQSTFGEKALEGLDAFAVEVIGS